VRSLALNTLCPSALCRSRAVGSDSVESDCECVSSQPSAENFHQYLAVTTLRISTSESVTSSDICDAPNENYMVPIVGKVNKIRRTQESFLAAVEYFIEKQQRSKKV